jgi:serine/threonine protein kinase
MSQDAVNLIVNLLNRNPSNRLGAGPEGAAEIKQHPFFSSLDWSAVENRQLPVPGPRHTMQQYRDLFKNVTCTEEQKKNIFEEIRDMDAATNQQVEGWSFVGESTQGKFSS